MYLFIRMGEAFSRPERYPVFLRNIGCIFGGQLRDVTGCPITSPVSGRPLNIYSWELQEEIEEGRIRFMFVEGDPSYYYLTTNNNDYIRFKEEREHGSLDPYTEYSVYYADSSSEINTIRRLIR